MLCQPCCHGGQRRRVHRQLNKGKRIRALPSESCTPPPRCTPLSAGVLAKSADVSTFSSDDMGGGTPSWHRHLLKGQTGVARALERSKVMYRLTPPLSLVLSLACLDQPRSTGLHQWCNEGTVHRSTA